MYHRTRMTAPVAVLALSTLLACGAAAQDVPRAKTPPDDHSYLPPWMRPQANARPITRQSQYLSAVGGPTLQQQEAQAQQPPHRTRRRRNLLDRLFSW
jgi:hypothetical protein